MLIIQIRFLLIFVFAAVIFIAVLAFNGYVSIHSVQHNDFLQIKYQAENILYVAVLFAVMLLSGLLWLFNKSRNLLRELDNISSLARYNIQFTGRYLNKLGLLGVKINRLYGELIHINEMQRMKISSVSNLNTVLVENIKMDMLVLDVRGVIAQCSKKVLTYLMLEQNKVVDKHISEIIQNFDFPAVMRDLEKTRNVILMKQMALRDNAIKMTDALFYPVFNLNNQLSTILCIFEGAAIAAELSKKSVQLKSDDIQKSRSFFNLFKKR